jgi:hypothetical protein
MICSQCTYSEGGHVGIDCPMRRIGVPLTFTGGCNLAMVKAEAKQAESKRVDALPDVPLYPKGLRRAEKDLQQACEGLLRQWGYRPSTAPEIEASVKQDATPVKGWYVHLWRCEGNPLLPDLLIFDATMRHALPIELKVVSVYQPGQREFINSGRWIECRDVPQFVEVVKGWEKDDVFLVRDQYGVVIGEM